MKMRTLLLSLALVAAAAVPAAAQDGCPVTNAGDDYLTKVIAAINATKKCGEGGLIAEKCQLGASGDVAIDGAVSAICQKDFAKNKDDSALYLKLAKRCEAKFAKMDGTLYRSAAAWCQMSVARLLSDLNSAPE